MGWLAIFALAMLPPSVSLGSDREPARCVARWQGPGEGCALQEAVSAEALGSTEKAGRKQVLKNLAAAVESARIHKAATLPAGARSLFLDASQSCDEVTESAIITCFPEPHLRSARYCWFEVDMDLCGQSQGFFLASRAWVQGEQTRAEICGQLPDDPFTEDTVDERSAGCQARCWQQGKLSCGAAR